MCFTFVTCVPSIAVCSLRARIHFTRLKVCYFTDASWCGVFPVRMIIIDVLTPFITLTTTCEVRNYSFDPYVSILQIDPLYNLTLRFRCIYLSFHK